jgi:hypothetical protein
MPHTHTRVLPPSCSIADIEDFNDLQFNTTELVAAGIPGALSCTALLRPAGPTHRSCACPAPLHPPTPTTPPFDLRPAHPLQPLRWNLCASFPCGARWPPTPPKASATWWAQEGKTENEFAARQCFGLEGFALEAAWDGGWWAALSQPLCPNQLLPHPAYKHALPPPADRPQPPPPPTHPPPPPRAPRPPPPPPRCRCSISTCLATTASTARW